MSNQVNYALDIRFPDQSPQRVAISSKLSLGSSEKSDVCIEEYGLSPMHLSFRVHNSVLSLHNLGGKNETSLENQVLNHGKMYILNIGDALKLGDIEIFIRAEEDQEVSDEYKNLFSPNDETVDNIEAPSTIVDSPKENENFIKDPNDLDDQPEFSEEEEENFDFKEFSSEDLSEEEEEEEFDDEYDEEVEKPNLLTKVTSIFKLKEKKDPRELEFKKVKVKKTHMPAPGIFTRFFAFIAKVCLSLALVSDIFPLMGIDKKLLPHITKVTNYLETIPYGHYLNSTFLQVVGLFILIELVFSLLLGMGLPDLLFGIRNERGFLISRVQAVLRTILSIITTPLLIFDLPSIVKKRTLKEVLTGSRLSVPSRPLQIIGIAIFFPIFLITPIITPVVLNLESFDTISVSEQRKVKIKKDMKIKNTWPSFSMKAKFSGNWDKSVTLLPTVKFYKKNLIPGLNLYLQKKKLHWIEVQYHTDFNIIGAIKEKTSLNPMFQVHYPDLKLSFKQKKMRELNPASFEQLKKLILNSLNLNFTDPASLFINHGPFFKDLSSLKTHLTSQLQLTPKSKVSYYSTPKKMLIFNELRTAKYFSVQTLVINSSGQSQIYKSRSSLKSANFAIKQIKNLFQNYKKIKSTDTQNSWDWAKTLDLLTTINETKKDITDLEIASAYDHYFENALKILNDGKELEERKELLEKFSKYIGDTRDYIESITEFNTLPKVTELSDSLERLNQAINNKNLEFFSINP